MNKDLKQLKKNNFENNTKILGLLEIHELLRVFLRFKIKNFHLDFRIQIKIDIFYFFYSDKIV